MKKLFLSAIIAVFVFTIGLAAFAEQATTTGSLLVGNDKDEHGCIGSAGYSWCAVLNKCIRPWEQKCEKKKATTTVDVACLQNAIDKRDNALITAWDKYSASMKKALETRRDALKTAATKTTVRDRSLASNKAWRDYNTAVAKARYALNKDKNVAWQAYNKTKKTCKLGKEDTKTVYQDKSL